MSQTSGALAILEHPVASFESWKATFDAYADHRARAGIRSARVSRAGDAVTVCLAADDAGTLRAFLADPARRQALERAGVLGPPTVTLADAVEDVTVQDRPLAGAFVRVRVRDFETWKRGFDERAAARAQAGVLGHAIAREQERPDAVTVLLQAEHADTLRRFTSADDTRAAMADSGVLGPPSVSIVEVLPVGR